MSYYLDLIKPFFYNNFKKKSKIVFKSRYYNLKKLEYIKKLD